MEKKPKFFETHEFISLQKQWYEKLDNEGFQDVETLLGTELFLINISPSRPNFNDQVSVTICEAKLTYYLFISQKLNEEQFDNQRDRVIMEMVSDGFKIQQIVRHLKEIGYSCHRQTVMYTIRRFENKWNIRRWSKQQLTSNRLTP